MTVPLAQWHYLGDENDWGWEVAVHRQAHAAEWAIGADTERCSRPQDEYGISHIAAYSARYGRHTRWAVEDLLATLAGRPINLAEERANVWHLLGGKDD